MWIKTTDDRLVNTDRAIEIQYAGYKNKTTCFTGDSYITLSRGNIVPQIADALAREQSFMEVR
jgi:hypothetical protein